MRFVFSNTALMRRFTIKEFQAEFAIDEWVQQGFDAEE